MKLRGKHDYMEYNKAILINVEETEMDVESKFQCWYHHRQDTLTPILDARNKVLYDIRSIKLVPSGKNLAKLRNIQWEVDKVIAI